MTRPLLITVGEPAGIGPDCVLLTWRAASDLFRDARIVCPPLWLEQRAAELGIEVVIHDSALQSDTHAPGLHCWNPLNEAAAPATAGTPSASTAAQVVACIEAAARACLAGEAAAMVTGPIEKAILRNCGFAWPGHTEFLAHLASDSDFVMMLASDQLRVALLTTHLAIADVPAALSTEATLACLRITHRDLRERFGIASPKLGLCGLNPHAGEQGHFGREEIDILAPAAAQSMAEGIDIEGPLPADTLFATGMRQRFDAIVCCYHDQGLIPLKTLSFGDAVNVTLGLPFIRTSVDHGTALTRAGTGDVSYSSFMNAIDLAAAMRRRAV